MDVLAARSTDLPFVTETTKRGGVLQGKIAAQLVRSYNAQQNNERLKVNMQIRARQGVVGSIPRLGSPLNSVLDILNAGYDTLLGNVRGDTAGLIQNAPVNAGFIEASLPVRSLRLGPIYQDKLIEAKAIEKSLGNPPGFDVEGSAEVAVLHQLIADKVVPVELADIYKSNSELGAQGAYDAVRNSLLASLNEVSSGNWDKQFAEKMLSDQGHIVLEDIRGSTMMEQWEYLARLSGRTGTNNDAEKSIVDALRKAQRKLSAAQREDLTEEEALKLKLQLQEEFTSELQNLEVDLKKYFQREIDQAAVKSSARRSPPNFLRQNLNKPRYAGGRQLWSDQAGDIAAMGRGIEALSQLLKLVGVHDAQSSKITDGMYATLHIADGAMAIQQTMALYQNGTLDFEEMASGFAGGMAGVLAGVNLLMALSSDPAEDPVFAMLGQIMEQLDQIIINQGLLSSGQQEIRDEIAQLERVTMYQFELLRTVVAETKNAVDQRSQQILKHVSVSTARLENMLNTTQEQVRLVSQTELVQKLRLNQLALEQLMEEDAPIAKINANAEKVMIALRDVFNLFELDNGPDHQAPTILHSLALVDIDAADQLAPSVYQQHISQLLPRVCGIARGHCSSLRAEKSRQLVTDGTQSLLDTAVLMHHDSMRTGPISVQFQRSVEQLERSIQSLEDDSKTARKLVLPAIEEYQSLLRELRNRVLMVCQSTARAQLEASGINRLRAVAVRSPDGQPLPVNLKDYRIAWSNDDGLQYGVERVKLQCLLTSQSVEQFVQPSLSEVALEGLLNEYNRYDPLPIELQYFAVLLLQLADKTPDHEHLFLRVDAKMKETHQAYQAQSVGSGDFDKHMEYFDEAYNTVGGWISDAVDDRNWRRIWRYLELKPTKKRALSVADALRSAQLNSGEQNTLALEMTPKQHQDMMISAKVALRETNPGVLHTGQQATLSSLTRKTGRSDKTTWRNLPFYYHLTLSPDTLMRVKPNNAKAMMEGRNIAQIDKLSKDPFLPNVTSVQDASSVFEYGYYVAEDLPKKGTRVFWQLSSWHTGSRWEMYDIVPGTNPVYAPKFYHEMMPVKKPAFASEKRSEIRNRLPGGALVENLPVRPGGVKRLFDGVNEARDQIAAAALLEQLLAKASMQYCKNYLVPIWNDRSDGGNARALPFVADRHRKAVLEATDNLPALLLSLSKARLGVQKLIEIGYGNNCIAHNEKVRNLYRLIFSGVRGNDWKRLDLDRNAGDTHSDVLVAAEHLDVMLERLEQEDLLPTEDELDADCGIGDPQINSQRKLVQWLRDWHEGGADQSKLTRGKILAALD